MNFEPGWLVYEDEYLLAVNKPSGLRTIPDGYDPSLPHLSGLMNQAFGRVWVVHRLDKETSGLLLFARDAGSHRALNLQFDQRSIRKTYHAIVAGSPPWSEEMIDLPLRVNGDRRHRTVVDELSGKPAATRVEVSARYPQAALLSAYPESGYTHQIRAHLAAQGFPILYDVLYRRPENPPFPELSGLTRLALHALRIQFAHPVSGAPLVLDAPYPADFAFMLAAMGTESPA